VGRVRGDLDARLAWPVQEVSERDPTRPPGGVAAPSHARQLGTRRGPAAGFDSKERGHATERGARRRPGRQLSFTQRSTGVVAAFGHGD
jgi:hypothetical protein